MNNQYVLFAIYCGVVLILLLYRLAKRLTRNVDIIEGEPSVLEEKRVHPVQLLVEEHKKLREVLEGS